MIKTQAMPYIVKTHRRADSAFIYEQIVSPGRKFLRNKKNKSSYQVNSNNLKKKGASGKFLFFLRHRLNDSAVLRGIYIVNDKTLFVLSFTAPDFGR